MGFGGASGAVAGDVDDGVRFGGDYEAVGCGEKGGGVGVVGVFRTGRYRTGGIEYYTYCRFGGFCDWLIGFGNRFFFLQDIMNRDKQDQLPLMQVGFIDSICLPIYEVSKQVCLIEFYTHTKKTKNFEILNTTFSFYTISVCMGNKFKKKWFRKINI